MTSIPSQVQKDAADERVVVERRGATAILTLNRPDKLNPIDWATIRALRASIASMRDEPELRIVVVTGAGRAFSAGGDLDGYVDLYRDPPRFQAFLDDFFAMLDEIERSPRIWIAAVNGHCVAGGLELALACDIVIAAREAKLADGHLNFGQLPGAGGSQRLPRAIGALRAKHMILTGAQIDGIEAERIGLAALAVPHADLMTATLALAECMQEKSPHGLAEAKRLVNDGADLELAQALRMEVERVHRYATTSHDAMEGLMAFRDKRKPRFEGH
ncbi:MAG: enoyl-CoA hydratase [Alphaproteobacteria bacterium]|nr:enoyl-CoA hydratase [Alphaproteobacteria bacterium]